MNEGGPPAHCARSASPLVRPHVVPGETPGTTSDVLRRLLRRVLRDLLLLPLIAFLTFQLMRALPLCSANEKLARNPVAEQRMREEIGFTRPLGFLRPWQRLARNEPLGNEGNGYRGSEVLAMLAGSLRVGAFSLSLALLLALGYALLRMRLRGAWGRLLGLLPVLVYGTPVFILALLAARLSGGGASVETDLRGFEGLLAMVMAIGPGAFLGQVLRQALERESTRTYVLLARSKGLSEGRILGLHLLPNALPTLLDSLGPTAATLLTGSFVAEKVFNVPYFGLLYVHAAEQGEVALVAIATTLFAAVLLLASLGAELLRMTLDPRARQRAEEKP